MTGHPPAPVDIAVVGLGVISQSVHLPLLRRHPEAFRLTAVVDLSRSRAEAIAAAHGAHVRAYASVGELIDAMRAGAVPVSGAILATSGSHAPDVGRLLQAGVRVLSEKPLSLSSAEIADLRALAEREGLDLTAGVRIGYMKEFDPASQAARRLLATVTPRAVRVEVLHPADGAQLAFANVLPPPEDVPAEAGAQLAASADAVITDELGELARRASGLLPLPRLYGNVVLGSVIHDIALLRYLLGGIGAVDHARHWGASDEGPGSLQLSGTLARRPGAPWTLDWHFIPDYPDYRETVTVHHERGSIELRFAVPYVLNAPTVLTVVERSDAPDGTAGEVRSEHRWMQQEAFENQLLAFGSLVAGDPRPGPTVGDASADLEVARRMIDRIAAG